MARRGYALLVSLLLSMLCAGRPAAAPATEMSVTLVPRSSTALSREAALVQLDGPIDARAPDRLAAALEGVDGRIDVWLNSAGGNLFAGMQLGRIIRVHGARTYIIDARTLRAGECYSACSLAFLGGVYRFNNNGARYGVHRASLRVGESAGGADLEPQLSAAVGSYIREMGVDARLLAFWQKAGIDDMYLMSQQDTLELGVANNGRQPPAWTITPSSDGSRLEGRQTTVDGAGMVSFSCEKERIVLSSVYDAADARDATTREWRHALTLDRSADIPVSPLRVTGDDGSVRTTFVVPPTVVRRAMTARQIGHRMTPLGHRVAAIGFGIDVDDASRPVVRDFLRTCLRDQVR